MNQVVRFESKAELGNIRLRDDHCSRFTQQRNRTRILLRDMVRATERAACRNDTSRLQRVLDRDGNSMQWASDHSAREFAVSLPRLREGALSTRVNDCVDFWVHFSDLL